jgi:spore coat protein SA
VVDGWTGFLVAPEAQKLPAELADRIVYLLANEGVRREMGRRGRERVLSDFQWRHTAERWVGFQRETGR